MKASSVEKKGHLLIKVVIVMFQPPLLLSAIEVASSGFLLSELSTSSSLFLNTSNTTENCVHFMLYLKKQFGTTKKKPEKAGKIGLL